MTNVKLCLNSKHLVKNSLLWRHCLKCLVVLSFLPCAVLAENSAEKPSASVIEPWMKFRPYAPELKEYSLEIGSMWEERNLYWLAGNIGFHWDKCMFSDSESCQHYFDIIGGVGGREGLTNGLLLGSLRWQWINFPKRMSPFARIFAGPMNIRDDKRDDIELAYGLGGGIVTSLHEHLDLRLEIRAGHADEFFSQAFVGFTFKIDKWVTSFGDRVKRLGQDAITGTVKGVGAVVRKTVETPGDVIDWLTAVEDKTAEEKKQKKPVQKEPVDGND